MSILSLVCALASIYLALGAAAFVWEVQAAPKYMWDNIWHTAAIFVLTLLFGGIGMILIGLLGIPWITGYVCGVLTARFRQGWAAAYKK